MFHHKRKIVAKIYSLILTTFIVYSTAPCNSQTFFNTEKRSSSSVSSETMTSIYEEIKTPYKYGIVLKGEEGTKIDSPSVFRYSDRWYMVYIIFNNTGYETRLAVSKNLLSWEVLGTIMSQGKGEWDKMQVAGYIALQDHRWDGNYTLGQWDGKYWLSYLGGALEGYETNPLAIGLAWTYLPDKPSEWNRLAKNPVLHRDQPDVRWWETLTLFKSNIIHDSGKVLGSPFVMFYNGANSDAERIGMAVSDDMVEWKRYGNDPVIDNGSGISGDPQITRIGDVWVMFYFGAFWRPKAFDTFACSYDLVHWTKWEGPDLIEPSEPWDETFAHKPWVIKHDGVVYHFYCAVGNQGRVIALATSKDVGRSPLTP